MYYLSHAWYNILTRPNVNTHKSYNPVVGQVFPSLFFHPLVPISVWLHLLYPLILILYLSPCYHILSSLISHTIFIISCTITSYSLISHTILPHSSAVSFQIPLNIPMCSIHVFLNLPYWTHLIQYSPFQNLSIHGFSYISLPIYTIKYLR